MEKNDFVVIRLKSYNSEYVIYSGLIDFIDDVHVWFTKVSIIGVTNRGVYQGSDAHMGIERKDIQTIDIIK